MNNARNSSSRVEPAEVTEHFPDLQGNADYADAFAIGRSPSDRRHAEQWARDGFQGLPLRTRRSGMIAHRHLLGFCLGPWSSRDHIFGWRIAESLPDVLRLEATGRVMDGHMIWRLTGDRLVMTTFVRFHQRRRAAALWAFAGHIHRRGVPALLKHAAKRAG